MLVRLNDNNKAECDVVLNMATNRFKTMPDGDIALYGVANSKGLYKNFIDDLECEASDLNIKYLGGYGDEVYYHITFTAKENEGLASTKQDTRTLKEDLLATEIADLEDTIAKASASKFSCVGCHNEHQEILNWLKELQDYRNGLQGINKENPNEEGYLSLEQAIDHCQDVIDAAIRANDKDEVDQHQQLKDWFIELKKFRQNNVTNLHEVLDKYGANLDETLLKEDNEFGKYKDKFIRAILSQNPVALHKGAESRKIYNRYTGEQEDKLLWDSVLHHIDGNHDNNPFDFSNYTLIQCDNYSTAMLIHRLIHLLSFAENGNAAEDIKDKIRGYVAEFITLLDDKLAIQDFDAWWNNVGNIILNSVPDKLANRQPSKQIVLEDLDDATISKIISIFEDELTNWSYEDFVNAGSIDKEDIAREAVLEFPNIPEQEIYDLFWDWVDGIDESYFTESLTEDLDDAKSIIADQIRGEWDAIKNYKKATYDLSNINGNFDEIIDILNDISDEEEVHVGELQKAQSLMDPELLDNIDKGDAEAEATIAETEAPVDESLTEAQLNKYVIKNKFFYGEDNVHRYLAEDGFNDDEVNLNSSKGWTTDINLAHKFTNYWDAYDFINDRLTEDQADLQDRLLISKSLEIIKLSASTVEGLDEALDYAEQEKKMDAWHSGVRGANVKQMSDEKLKMNYDICKSKNYLSEKVKLWNEAVERLLPWAPYVTLQPSDFHFADLQFVKDHLTDKQAFKDCTVLSTNRAIRTLMTYLAWAVVLGEKDLQVYLKDLILNFYCDRITIDSLRTAMKMLKEDPTIMQRISDALSQLDEGLTESSVVINEVDFPDGHFLTCSGNNSSNRYEVVYGYTSKEGITTVEFKKNYPTEKEALKAFEKYKANYALTEELDNPKISEIDSFIDDVYKLRQDSLKNEGEYSTGNLVFKTLRNKGYLDNLKDLKNQLIGKELSLESLEGTVNQDLADNRQPVNPVEEGPENEPYDYKKEIIKQSGLEEDYIEDEETTPYAVIYRPWDDDEIIDYYDLPEEAEDAYWDLVKNYYLDYEYVKLLVDDTIVNEKHFNKIEERLDERQRYQYRDELSRIAFNQAVIQDNGLFHIYNIKENDVDRVLSRIRALPYIAQATKTAGRYDFSKMVMPGQVAPRYFEITGKIKEGNN